MQFKPWARTGLLQSPSRQKKEDTGAAGGQREEREIGKESGTAETV